MRHQFRVQTLFVVLLTVAVFSGCSEDPTDPSKAATLIGETTTIAGAEFKSWLKLDEDGNPEAIGVTFSEAAFEELEADTVGFAHELALPEEASATAYKHLGLRWKPQGSTAAPYQVPFLDVDFFEITNAQRDAMMPEDSLVSFKQPDPEYLPSGYALRNGTVPGWGSRYSPGWGTPASDSTKEEFHGEEFKHGIIYYYYDGLITTSVVKVNLSYLQSIPELKEAMKLPQQFREDGLYQGSTYEVMYDAEAKEYSIFLGDMIKR